MHFVIARPVQSRFGSRWQVRISGPRMSLSKVTLIYCDASRSAVITAVAAYFKVNAESLVLPPIRPDILIGFDVETSDWDDACSFSNQDQHFDAGHPCGQDHRGSSGHVCAMGFAVFRRRARDSNEYVAEEPQVRMVKLPGGEHVAKKASDVHGYTDFDCSSGLPFSEAIVPILNLLQEGAQLVCHNLPHETLVICREVQKLNLLSARPLLQALFSGHCTLSIARKRHGYRRKLSEVFRSFFGEEGFNFRDHNPGHDAAKCARLFLYYNKASVGGASSSVDHPVKRCKV